MPTMTMSYTQILELVKQLPSAQQAEICEVLIENCWGSLSQFTMGHEEHARLAAWKRNQDWDAMDDKARIDFADELVHEDRFNVL